MAKKDKFAQLRQDRGVGSFQESLVHAATTVAAIEKQQEQRTDASGTAKGEERQPLPQSTSENKTMEWEVSQFMRLPNPQIPLKEYNLVSLYCSSLPNMTRQDFVELAIVEKLYNLGQITEEDFLTRQAEIRSRPPRGQRKGTKQISK